MASVSPLVVMPSPGRVGSDPSRMASGINVSFWIWLNGRLSVKISTQSIPNDHTSVFLVVGT